MSGGRLTQQDRRRIAAGLAGGLGYAEIARRLGRPTSTVSREVTRNGGRAGYRADGAQRATRQRARRHLPTHVPTGTVAGTGSGAVRGFTERFAELMVETGMPRMAARVFAALSTSDSGSLAAADLVRLLEVSPASVSGAVGYLTNLDLLTRRRGTDPGRAERSGRPDRRERYAVEDDVWMRSWLVSARQHARWAETAREGVALLGTGTPAGERLARMATFFDRLSADMSAGPIPPDAIADLVTVVAALVRAAAPVTLTQLSAALAWPPPRTAAALRHATTYPEITDPVAIRPVATPTTASSTTASPDATAGSTTTERFVATAASGRLSTAQGEALDRLGAGDRER